MLDHPTGASRAMLLLYELNLLPLVLPHPPFCCLESMPSCNDTTGGEGGKGIMGSAGREEGSLFNLKNMQQTAVNLLMTTHLFGQCTGPPLVVEGQGGEGDKRAARLLRWRHSTALPYHIISYHIISYHVITHYIISCYTISYLEACAHDIKQHLQIPSFILYPIILLYITTPSYILTSGIM